VTTTQPPPKPMKSHPFVKMCLGTQAFDDVDGDTTQDVVLFLGAHVNIKKEKTRDRKNGKILLLVLVLFFLLFCQHFKIKPLVTFNSQWNFKLPNTTRNTK
jgi:hypothetical protein